jgi:CHASE2 domain-containing sensor protein
MIRNKSQAFRTALILMLSVSLVVLVTWFTPSLTAASLGMLFRLRGGLSLPDEVVILAIDDQSLQRLGRWPWPRSVMAGVLDRLTPVRPLVVGLDIIYAEPSAPGAWPQPSPATAGSSYPRNYTRWLRPLSRPG